MSLSRPSENTVRQQTHRKHLVFINYYYPPMGGGGVQRLVKFLKYFDYQNYEVTVLTVKPSYFYTSDETLAQEIPPQVRVLRSGSLDPFRLLYFWERLKAKISARSKTSDPCRESDNRIRRISMSLFVPDSRVLWLPFALVKLWQLHRIRPVDLTVASMPPFTSGLIGALFQRWMNTPVVLDFRDAWTGNPYLPHIGSLYAAMNEKLERFCMENATGFTFVNPKLQEYYRKKYPSFSDRPITTIRNGFDPDDFRFQSNVKSAADQTKRPFTLGIMGTIYSQGNRPISLLQATKEMIEENPRFQSRLKLAFLGKWSSDFLNLLNRFDLDDMVELIPYMPHREALQKAADFDALSLSIESGLAGSEFVTPGRIYEYLQLKKPILALCPLSSDLADLVRNHCAGEAIEFNEVKSIKAVLMDWVENRSALHEKYKSVRLQELSRAEQTKSLLEFLSQFG